MRIFTIGRKDTDIVLPDPNKDISRRHAELTLTDDGKYHLADCGSSNGTFIKRARSGAARWESLKQDYVTEQDLLRFGSSEISLRDLLRLLPTTETPETPRKGTSPPSGELGGSPPSRNWLRDLETRALI